MPKIKNILFPVDFSERACGAAPFVAAFMNRFGAKATLLHVVEPMPYVGYADGGPMMGGAPMAVDLEALQAEAQVYLAQSLLKEFEKLPVKRVVEIGNAAETIIRFAESDASDLIMMPTHGYGPFRSLLLGSVASKVLHDAWCPVWTATHTKAPPAKNHLPCGSVLCAVDGSDNSLSVLQWAADFAKQAGALMRVLHVIPGPGEWINRTLDIDLEKELRRRARTMIEKLQVAAGIDVPICINVGELATTIEDEVKAHETDALIIGRGALHKKLGRLRAHSYQIIRTAPCPVISV